MIMRRHRNIILYLLASLLVSAAIYRDAMWGGSLLAPLDIGPDVFSQYKFMDPGANGIPDNHYIIDQFSYDLPLQYDIYQAYHQGEIPWWDPYTYGGRPLLADAHINGTDPIRLLCYAVLPFELAYNWNYILRGIVTGLGMLWLLRVLGVRPLVASILALTYQYAGWFTLFFGHPWIQGSFLYFPFLWVVWLRAVDGDLGKNTALGGILCGLVFYAGNLQSHPYLVLFALAFVGAILFKSRRKLPRALAVCSMSGVIGALLAFPVLSIQVEFYMLSLRAATPANAWYSNMMAAPLSICAFYPWCLGSFRSLDAARLFNAGGIGFSLFFGAAGSFLAVYGAWIFRKDKGVAGVSACQSLLLVGIYLLVIATPVSEVLYSRCACLAGMGLTVLAGLAVQAILDGRCQPSPLMVRSFVGLVIATALASSVFAWFVFPSFRETIRHVVLKEMANQSSYPANAEVSKMRMAQVENIPREISLRNPEAAITLLATMLFGCGLLAKDRDKRRRLLMVSLCVSAVPVLLFHDSFRPKHPIKLWQRLLAGGPVQQEAIKRLEGGLRFDETSGVLSGLIFPNAMAALYHIHGVYGYSALQPPSLFRLPPGTSPPPKSWQADRVPAGSGDAVAIADVPGANPSRFRNASDGTAAAVRVTDESQNTLVLDISHVPQGAELIRTDTWYPGWSVSQNVGLNKITPCFSKIGPINADGLQTLRFEYAPSLRKGFVPAVSAGLLMALGLYVASALKRQPRPATDVS